MSFTHKVVAITGGGTGMGKAVAQALLKQGSSNVHRFKAASGALCQKTRRQHGRRRQRA